VLMGWPESDPRAPSSLAAFRDALAKPRGRIENGVC